MSSFDSVLFLVLNFSYRGRNLLIGLVLNNTARTTPSAPFMSSRTSPIFHNARMLLSLYINTMSPNSITLLGSFPHVWCSHNSFKYSWFQRLRKCPIIVWMYFIFILITKNYNMCLQSHHYIALIKSVYLILSDEGIRILATSLVYMYPNDFEFFIPSTSAMIVRRPP